MIKRWTWLYSWVDWKFSFELITFPVFANGWMIIMITCLLFFPFQPVKQWTDIRVYSNGWINLLMAFKSGQTVKRSGKAVWRDKQLSGFWTYKPFTARITWTAMERMKIFLWTDGSVVRTADDFLWADGSAVRTAEDFGMYQNPKQRNETTELNLYCRTLYKHWNIWTIELICVPKYW